MPFAGRCPRTGGILATVIALVTAVATSPPVSANRGGGDPSTNFRALDTAAKPSRCRVRKEHATAEKTAYDRIFSTMKAMEAIVASKGITDPSIVAAVGMLAEAYSLDEGLLIEPIGTPFLHKNSRGRPSDGIWMESYGEPKSGTTWTERVITELVLQLCGSSTNTWCKMGGLNVIPKRPDPSYQWEMLHADTGKLYMHFDGRYKHIIPGLDVGEECNPYGREHAKGFATELPCKKRPRDVTRRSLLKCLPITSERCAEQMPSRDPAVGRTSVVFRDPREVVISERRMRVEVYLEKKVSELDPFIYERFEASPQVLADLAAFIGLNCSEEHAVEVLNRHKNQSPHGKFDTYDLPLETIEYMNTTMSKLLPEDMLARYGLSTTSL